MRARATARRIAVIRSEAPSTWGSCTTIVPNLEQAYRSALGRRMRTFSFETGMDPARIWKIAEEIATCSPERIVFMDHLPHPGDLLGALAEIYDKKRLPPVVAHLYGDFTLHSEAWLKIEPVLRETGLLLVCASERQGGLVSGFVRSPRKTVEICAFPTDARRFRPDLSAGSRWRRMLGLGSRDFAIGYAGRISLQKNVLRLIREFVLMRRWSGIPARLVLAGQFDDLGAPLFGVETPRNFYYQQLESLLAELPRDDRRAIHCVGNLDAEDLRGLYNAVDCYASLSLHHDEDFGLAPAEALLCGTPVLLTDWGGYAGFLSPLSRECRGVPVTLGRRSLMVRSGQVQKALLELSMSRPTADSRRALSREFGQRLSIESVAIRLRELMSRPMAPFSGFSPLLRHLSRASRFYGGAPFQSGPRKGLLYERVYGSYLSDTSQ